MLSNFSLDEAKNLKQVVFSQIKHYCNKSQGIPQPDRAS
jgi:hypothetical protein